MAKAMVAGEIRSITSCLKATMRAFQFAVRRDGLMSFSKWAGMKSRRAFLGAALGATAVVSLQAEPAVAQDKLIPFAISTARSAAGVPEYYAKKYGIFEKNGLDVKMTEFAGAGNSIAAIQGGSLQAAYVIPGSAFTAIQNGLDLVFVAQQEVSKRTAPDTGSLQVLATSNIQTLADLKGKRLSVGAPKSGTELNTRAVLAAAGLTYNDLGKVEYLDFNQSVELIKNRQLDATLQSVGLGNSALRDLANSVDIVVVPIPADIASKIPDKAYAQVTIPANTYKGVGEVKTIAVGAQWVTSAKQPDALIYEITKAVWNDNSRKLLDAGHAKGKAITKAIATAGAGIPFHPGAEKFYKEAGLLK